MNRNMIVKLLLVGTLVLSLISGVFAQTTTDTEPSAFDWLNIPQSVDLEINDSFMSQLQETVQNLPDMLSEFETTQDSNYNRELIGPSFREDATITTWFDRMIEQLQQWRSLADNPQTPKTSISDSWYLQDLLVE